MKSYVIAIESIPQSVQAANRCIKSMPEFDIQMHFGYTPKDNPKKMMEDLGIDPKGFVQKPGLEYSYEESAMAAFLSHRSLWQKCFDENEEVQIFEHDAVAVGNIPDMVNYKYCISLGHPSYGKWNTPTHVGVNPLTSKRYFPGAHAYRMKPAGAKIILEMAKTNAMPTDIFMNLDNFPFLEEYYPWPVMARESFSTIQREKGCLAKHGYGEGYQLLRENQT